MKVSRFDVKMQRPSVVAFGVFDGLHLGHQALLAHLVELSASGATPTIVTFDPHPALVLAPAKAPLLIGTLEQRLEGFAALGIQQAAVLEFDEASALESAAAFVERVLVGHLGVVDLVVGDDVHFGRDRSGDVELLRREGSRRGFRVHVSPTYGSDQRYSSTAVRELLRAGDVLAAAEILGRPFALRGTVVHGDARGRELGFATANLRVQERQVLPALGIYAAAVLLASGEWRAGAASVGTRPQFYDNGGVLVEVHLIDFDGDLYDQVLNVAFLQRLRGEATFETVQDLRDQIGRDVANSRDAFEVFTPEASVLLG